MYLFLTLVLYLPLAFTQMSYDENGRVILQSDINIIYYGNWSFNDQERINYFFSNVGESEWFKPVTKYYQQLNGKKEYITTKHKFNKAVNDSDYSSGKDLTVIYDEKYSILQNPVKDIILKQFKNPKGNALYLVLVSDNVKFTGSYPSGNETSCGIIEQLHDTFQTDEALVKFAIAGMAPIGSQCINNPYPVSSHKSSVEFLIKDAAIALLETITNPTYYTWNSEFGHTITKQCAGQLPNLINPNLSDPEFNTIVGNETYILPLFVDLGTSNCTNIKIPVTAPEADKGLVITKPNIQIIYYGTWTVTEIEYIKKYFENVGKSDWAKPIANYYQMVNGSKENVDIEGLQLKGTFRDVFSMGKSLTKDAKSNQFADLIAKSFSSNTFSADVNTLYYILVSEDVALDHDGKRHTDFCHLTSYFTHRQNNMNYHYAVVPKQTKESACFDRFATGIVDDSILHIHSTLKSISNSLVNGIANPEGNGWQFPKSIPVQGKCEIKNIILADMGGVNYHLPPVLDPLDNECKPFRDNGKLYYNGGPVIKTPKIRLTYYGNWSQDNTDMVKSFIKDLGSSKYFEPTTKFYEISNGTKEFVTGQIDFNQNSAVFDKKYSIGKKLNEETFELYENLIKKQLEVNGPNENDIYVIMLDSEASNFFTYYCGFHTFFKYNGMMIKFIITSTLAGCGEKRDKFKTDYSWKRHNIINILSHEILETITDPLLNSWQSGNFQENIDLCAQTFSQGKRNKHGKFFNHKIGNEIYYLASNYDLESQSCVVN